MTPVVQRARVKEKLGLTGTEHDAPIDALIAEFLPVVEYALDPAVPGAAQASIDLGATELVAAEYLRQRLREPGAMAAFRLGPLEISGAREELAEAARLEGAGLARLRPFLRLEGVLAPAMVRELAEAEE